MLSKMAQPNSSGGGGGSGSVGGIPGGRRAPGALSGNAGNSSAGKQQQVAGSNGHSSPAQNSNAAKKKDQPSQSGAPQTVAIKEIKKHQQSAQSNDGNKTQNGAKSTSSKEKLAQNGNTNVAAAKEQKEQKAKEKVPEKKEQKPDVNVNNAKANEETKEANETKNAEEEEDDVVFVDNIAPPIVSNPSTPTSERKSTRKNSTQLKSASSKPLSSPTPKNQPDAVRIKEDTQEDVEMEPLAMESSPIKCAATVSDAQPAATSTPGRSNLFGFKNNKKNINEVELASQLSASPAAAPPRTFAQISGRRSIRPLSTLTPSKLESYRSTNELDSSSCTNTSMNATVGSEIHNDSTFNFYFFGRGRKRERTPPPLVSSSLATELANDLDKSPPKRARFELFSMNLATPFTMLRSRFSKASISTPARLNLEENQPSVDDEEGGVQNVSGIVIEEEPLNTSSKSTTVEVQNEVTVGQEAGLETPKKSGTPVKSDINIEGKDKDHATAEAEISTAVETAPEGVGANRSRCAIM